MLPGLVGSLLYDKVWLRWDINTFNWQLNCLGPPNCWIGLIGKYSFILQNPSNSMVFRLHYRLLLHQYEANWASYPKPLRFWISAILNPGWVGGGWWSWCYNEPLRFGNNPCWSGKAQLSRIEKLGHLVPTRSFVNHQLIQRSTKIPGFQGCLSWGFPLRDKLYRQTIFLVEHWGVLLDLSEDDDLFWNLSPWKLFFEEKKKRKKERG